LSGRGVARVVSNLWQKRYILRRSVPHAAPGEIILRCAGGSWIDYGRMQIR